MPRKKKKKKEEKKKSKNTEKEKKEEKKTKKKGGKKEKKKGKKTGKKQGKLLSQDFKTTAEIDVPDKIVDQVLGQEKGVGLIRKAASQGRNVFLLGDPGTGKSMLGMAMAELLPVEKLKDVLVYPNQFDPNNPEIRTVPSGKGKEIVDKETKASLSSGFNRQVASFIIFLFVLAVPWVFYYLGWMKEIMAGASLVVAGMLGIGIVLGMQIKPNKGKNSLPKLLVDNRKRETAPFVEATGARAGALLGDVRHDPLQCIPGDELVHDPHGRPLEIQELVEPFFNGKESGEVEIPNSFSVLTGYDQKLGFVEAPVHRVFKREYNGDLVEITTKRGYSFRVTPNHPIAMFDHTCGVSYVEAGKLETGCYAVVPEKLPVSGESKLDRDTLLFLADILADGHVASRSVQFKLRKKYKINQIQRDAEKAGFKPRVLKRGQTTFIYVNSASFVRYLKSIGLIEKGSKRLPPILFDLPLQDIHSFLIRFLSLDGYVNVNGQIELVSKELIPDFIPLLLKIGLKAKYRPRKDPGFSKGKMQPRVFFQDYEFLKHYYDGTINPVHQKNLREYLAKTNSGHVTFDDVIPVSFSFLEGIRKQTGLSKTKVHREYYALNQELDSSKLPTRQFLQKISHEFSLRTNNKNLSHLQKLVEGDYAFDEIVEIKRVPYSGFVYNLGTKTGTYLVNNVLTHNSGGLGTPPHLRVEVGMIHKAHMGVLFIDEIATLSPKSQQELLTAMQEKKYSITGQSELSSGAMVHTEPTPCNFVLVAAGNLQDMEKMHPALRSRIRGYGYEIYLNSTVEDNQENRDKIAQFVAQEVNKDGKIPHFTREAVEEMVLESRRRAGRKNKLTVRFRGLGGLARAAGDVASSEGAEYVEPKHVRKARKLARTMEQQIADQYISNKKEYEVFSTEGARIGKVNGLGLMGDGGIMLPIESEIAPAHSKEEGEMIATGKLGDIAKEAVQNVGALVKKYKGEDISNYDVHVQFLQTYEGVEGDSASVSVATALVSALEELPVDQSVAMTGSLSVRGEVLPVGGITQKVEAAIDAGIERVIIPKANEGDVFLSEDKKDKVKIVTASDLCDVVRHAFQKSEKREKLLKQIKSILR